MINTLFTLQLFKKNKELIKKLHEDMNSNFLEHTMYDINDALTSILALCDMEQMKSIPKVKNYIQRVNELLDYIQIYQDKELINVNHVLNNIVDIIKDRFKDRVTLSYSFNPVKAFIDGSQPQLEHILLSIFIELIESSDDKNSEISIKLNQKEQDAQIFISKNNFTFSPDALKEIDLLCKDFAGSMNTQSNNKNTEIDIRIPLSFKKFQAPAYSLEVIPRDFNYKPVKSFKKS